MLPASSEAMKSIIMGMVRAAVLMMALTHAGAIDANGLRLTVQKTMLDSEKNRDQFYDWDKVKKAYALRCDIKNTSFNDLPAGTLRWTVILKKWGRNDLYYRYKGEEEFPALPRGKTIEMIVGKIPIEGYEMNNSRSEYVDSIEGYQVVILHERKETIAFVSPSSFKRLDEKAEDVKGKGKKPRE